MSPYLFVLCMKKLGQLIQEKSHKGQWKSLKSSRNGPNVTHLLFADDFILFSSAKDEDSATIKEVLHEFCGIFGLKVNLKKSKSPVLPKHEIPLTHAFSVENVALH